MQPACTGEIAGPVDGGPPASGVPNGGSSGLGSPPDGSGGSAGGEAQGGTTFATSPGLRRLTRAEYEGTLSSLLGIQIDKARVPRELTVRGHSQIAGAQKTGYADVDAYYEIALAASEQAVPRILADISCDAVACARAWLGEFLRLAFRRPADPDLFEEYSALLSLEESGASLHERMITAVTAVLSSPLFLYKQEIGTPVSGMSLLRTLDDYEIATRLSYLIWQTGPDADLLARAEQGSLVDPAARTLALWRMLERPEAQAGLRNFVLDWMGTLDNRISTKDVRLLESVGAAFPAAAERSLELLLGDQLSPIADATFLSVLAADRTFVNAALAPIYGLDQVGDEFEKITLAAERRGILSHPLVIAAHSKESGASPFPIGHFVFENVLCESIPPPPDGVPPVPEDEASEQTLRQRLEAATANEPCYSCHVRIGPPGFAFLPFDPIGGYHPEDGRGRPYDTSGELLLDSMEKLPFNDAADMARQLSEHGSAARCVARRLFRWTHGRFESSADAENVRAIELVASSSRARVVELLEQLVRSEAFAQVHAVP